MRIVPDLERLGIRYLVKDHLDTLYEIDDNGHRKVSRSDICIFYGTPAVIAITSGLLGIELNGLAEIIGGMAILTGLLFGLLVHVFTLGLRLKDDKEYTASSKVAIMIDELRANVSYACGVALVLTVLLMVAAALAKNTAHGLNVIASSVAMALFANLVFTLLMVINRVRSAYRKMAI